ncbi:MAG: amino acid adenylation domain-containing protein, partial [Candidatus Aminicenantes bacterium]|nr:amino acid adenylation domain-containing protein [Candidatus Aminicenantes bacterium]
MIKEKGQKINRQKIEDILALTPLQEGMLFHYLRDPDSDLYFEQLCLQISGVVDADIIKKAWNFVIASNEMLRTVFRWKKMKKPVQMVLKEHQPELNFFDLSRDEPEKNEKIKQKLSKEVYSTAEIKSEDRREKFDLEQVPFRVTLCKIAKDKYEMVISNHHILYDGWSNGIILKEFFAAYNEFSSGREMVKPGKNKFKEYVRWVGDRDGSKQEKFWKKYLAEAETASEISLKRAGGREISATGNFNAKLGKSLREKLEELVKKNKITMPSLLYTAYGVLLQKYNNITDVIFGTTVSGRSAKIKDIENIVGLFINTLPLRVQTDSAEKTVDLIKKVNEAVQLREEYEATPLVAVKEYSNSGSAEPFDSIVVVENYPLDKALMQGQGPLSINGYSIFEMTNYDLTIALVLSEEVDINFIYNGQCFEQKVIERLSVHFSNILEEIADDPGGEIGKIEILSSREKKQLLFEFNYRKTGFSTAKTIPRLFARQVERIPENTALLGSIATGQKGTRSLTYRQLDEESNRLATYLFEKGVTGNHLVGILVGRTIEMITGILGILKSGSGYVPLNPKVPAGRNAYILEECGVELLLTTRSLYDEVETYRNLQVEIVFIEEGIRERQENRPVRDAYMPPEPNPPMHPETDLTLNSPENLAYVIFTSGSTGKPKGVSITHANFCALMHWGYAVMELGSQDRVVQNLSYYFDWSVWEIFIALTSGAALYMVQEDVMLNPENYTDFMNSNRITTLHITPTQFQTLTHTGRELNSMKHLAIGAEKLTLDLVQRALTLVNENCRVYNMYGPTEATIMAAVLEIDKEKDGFYKKLSGIPIGPPIANTDFFILDKDMNPVPLFAVGELYIGGDGLSMGYLNKPELTNEKFIDNPYQEFPTHHSDLLYKTGDLACWLPDGTVEFLGRIDQQVKIRGFRIEPGEIENQLLQHEAVKEAFVMVRQHDNDDNYLCAYIVAKNSNSVEGLVFPREEVSPESNLGAQRAVPAKNAPGAVELQQYLSQSLPDYMIPTYFVDLEKMPLNPNGKIDIKSLPEPETADKGREFIAPRDEAEEKLVKIWCDVLGLVRAKEISRQVGIDDNFFESGGHSLKAARLSALIHKEFDVEIPLSTIFKNPTIRKISGYIRETERSKYSGLKPAKVKEYYPLSLAQKRLYVLQQMEKNSRVYNMPAVLSVEGKINREKFEQAFKKLIARHESLRTSFTLTDEQPVQIIHKAEDIDFKIEEHEEAQERRGMFHKSQLASSIIGR